MMLKLKVWGRQKMQFQRQFKAAKGGIIHLQNILDGGKAPVIFYGRHSDEKRQKVSTVYSHQSPDSRKMPLLG